MKKILFAFWLTLLVGHSAHAQIWQAYKGVWLKGYDNATQAPIPPTGYSALTYFSDSLGTYVYDWDSLAWLRIPGAGGGGSAGLTSASNGLNVNPAGNVKLGGTLTENTNIVGGGHVLNITSTSGSDNGLFEVRPTQNRSQVSSSSSSVTETMQDDAYSLVMTDNATYSNTFSVSPSTMRLFRSGSAFTYAGEVTLGSSGITLSHGLANGRALTFAGTTTNRVYRMSSDLNNSLDFNFANSGQVRLISNDRLILDGATVEMPAIAENTNLTDSVMMLDGSGRIFWKTISGGGGGFTTADNGLTASSATNVQLGGTLIKNTTIPLAGFSYTVGQFPDNVNFSVDDASNTITANLSAGSNGALFSMTASNAVLQHSGASGSATLTLNQSSETATISSTSGSALNVDVSNPNTVTLLADGGGLSQIVAQSQGAGGQFRINNTAGGGRLFVGNTAATNDNIISVEDAEGSISLSTEHASGTYPAQLALRGTSDDLMIHAGSGRQLNILGTGSGSVINIDVGTGRLQILNIPTTDPCGSAPTGTVWSDSGTLKICP